MSKKIGLDHKVFYKASALSATPANAAALSSFSTEWDVVRAVSVSKQVAEIDMSTRESFNDQFRNAGENVEFQIMIFRDPADAAYVNLERARKDRTGLALVFSSGSISDNEIMDAGNWSVAGQTHSEERKEGTLVTFTLKPRDEYYTNLLPSIS